MTAANAIEEARQEGRKLDIPYWRTLKADDYLNEKLPGGLEGHKALLEVEGFTVAQKGKRQSLPGHESVLFEMTFAHPDGYLLTATPAARRVQYWMAGYANPGCGSMCMSMNRDAISRYASHSNDRAGCSDGVTGMLILYPVLLVPMMAGIFWLAPRWLGAEAGYLLGFGFYWLFWCLLVPRWVVGKAEFAALLRDRAPLFSRANWLAALLWLTITLVSVFMYAGEFLCAPLTLILLAAPLATVNGFCEEILWRGLYVRRFPQNPWMAILYPSLGFALWHLAPQVIFPAENVMGFVVSIFFLALPYGYIAYRTGSAKWTAISHSLSGTLALSGYLGPSVLALIF